MDESELPVSIDTVTRMALGLLLYRLGGEQSFTVEEMDDIRATVAGVAIFITPEGKLLFRTKTPGQTQQAREEGMTF